MSMVAIVSADGPANVGDLLVILSPTGTLEGKEGAVGDYRRRDSRCTARRWLAYYKTALSRFGIDRLEGYALQGAS